MIIDIKKTYGLGHLDGIQNDVTIILKQDDSLNYAEVTIYYPNGTSTQQHPSIFETVKQADDYIYYLIEVAGYGYRQGYISAQKDIKIKYNSFISSMETK